MIALLLAVTFNHGLYFPDDLSSLSDVKSKDCGSCHARTHEEWKDSRHAAAVTNRLFQDSFAKQPAERCLYCHSPHGKSKAAAKEGVGCLACHGSGHSGDVAALEDPKFCAGCHQFNFALELGAITRLGNVPSQNTYREWLAYKAGGGTETCQSCHMKDGSHAFHGAHHLSTLKKAIVLSVLKKGDVTEFVLKSNGVGHDFPTGDIFRRLVLETNTSGRFKPVAVLGRKVVWKAGVAERVENTALGPSEERRVAITAAHPFRYRLVYYFASNADERKILVEGKTR